MVNCKGPCKVVFLCCTDNCGWCAVCDERDDIDWWSTVFMCSMLFCSSAACYGWNLWLSVDCEVVMESQTSLYMFFSFWKYCALLSLNFVLLLFACVCSLLLLFYSYLN